MEQARYRAYRAGISQAVVLQAGNRVVWWSDPDGEFAESVAELSLGNAEVVSVADAPALAIKRQVELDILLFTILCLGKAAALPCIYVG